MNHLNYIVQPLIVLISLVGIFIGIIVTMKCSGKLKASMILIVMSTSIIFIYDLLGIISLTGNAISENLQLNNIAKTNSFGNIHHLMLAITLTISLFLMKNIIDNREEAYRKKK